MHRTKQHSHNQRALTELQAAGVPPFGAARTLPSEHPQCRGTGWDTPASNSQGEQEACDGMLSLLRCDRQKEAKTAANHTQRGKPLHGVNLGGCKYEVAVSPSYLWVG
jgi:hypothetical protein